MCVYFSYFSHFESYHNTTHTECVSIIWATSFVYGWREKRRKENKKKNQKSQIDWHLECATARKWFICATFVLLSHSIDVDVVCVDEVISFRMKNKHHPHRNEIEWQRVKSSNNEKKKNGKGNKIWNFQQFQQNHQK